MKHWWSSDLHRCPRSSLLINLQSNRFLCVVWKDRKICPETSQIGASFWFFSSLRFFFFTLITNNLALTYSLKYDNANKMRQCENIFVFIDLTKSIGSDLGGLCPPRPPPPQTPPMLVSDARHFSLLTSRAASSSPSIWMRNEYRCSGLGSGRTMHPSRDTGCWDTLLLLLSL